MNTFVQLAQHLCEHTNTSRALTVYLLLKYEEYEQAVQLTLNPRHYFTAYDFHLDWQVTELVRKVPFFPGLTRKELEDRTKTSFFSLQANAWRTHYDLLDQGEEPWFEDVRRICTRVLSRVKSDRQLEFRHGPGATRSHKGEGKALMFKFGRDQSSTEGCLPFAGDIPCVPWNPTIVESSRISIVAKTAMKGRVIFTSPSVNMCLQLLLGDSISRALEKEGIRILKNSSSRIPQIAELNGARALEGSANQRWFTLDLEDGSDNILNYHVNTFFKNVYDVLYLLSVAKTPYLEVDDTTLSSAIFAPQGNGSTFAVETLIFYAVAASVDPEARVNGDDVTARTEFFDEIVRRFKRLGFRMNMRKTYADSLFRESCGTEGFNGESVWVYRMKKRWDPIEHLNRRRPALTKIKADLPRKTLRRHIIEGKSYGKIPFDLRSVYAVLNGLRRSGFQRYCWVNPGCRSAWVWLYNQIPQDLRLHGPEYLGDAVIHGPRSKWRTRNYSGIHYVLGLLPERRLVSVSDIPEMIQESDALMAYALNGNASRVSIPSKQEEIGKPEKVNNEFFWFVQDPTVQIS